jgi:copper(I)-binding protein
MQGDLMKMQHVPSVDIPAGGDVTFAPMAYHVMLLNLKDRSLLSDGKRFPVTLHFEKAGDVTVEVAVQKQAPDTVAHVHKP